VSLSAGESKTIQFDGINLPNELDALVNVSFADNDFLSDDDQVNIPVLGRSTVDITLASLGQEPQDASLVFIATAVETNGDARVEVLDASAALAPSVRHAIVFVDDITDIPDSVTRFVMDGGNALIVPSDVALPGNASASSASSTITRIDLAHALRLGDINWFETHFYSAPAWQTTNDDQLLMSLDTGEPILVERTVGDRGKMLMLNDALDGRHSDLPLQPSFVLLMGQIVEYFSANNAIPSELVVGQDLFLPANSQLLTPDADPVLELSQLGSANSIRIESPGVYSVLGASSTELVSVVLDRGESNLLSMSQDELDAWEARHGTDATGDAATTGDIEAKSEASSPANTENRSNLSTVSDRQDTLRLWRWLLPAVLLFLIAESLYANRMLWVRRDGLSAQRHAPRTCAYFGCIDCCLAGCAYKHNCHWRNRWIDSWILGYANQSHPCSFATWRYHRFVLSAVETHRSAST